MMKYTLTLIIALTFCVRYWSQEGVRHSPQDSVHIEQLLDSALNLVYKHPVESKLLLDSTFINLELNPYFTSKLLNYKGIAYDVMGHNDSALMQYHSALSIAEAHKIWVMQARVSNNIGLIFWKKGEYESAIARYDFSLRQFTKLGETRGAANTLNNMGLIYQKMKDYDMSLASFMAARAAYEEIGDDRGKSAVLMNLAAVKDLQNDLDSSSYYFLEAIQLKKKVNDTYGLGLAYSDYSKSLDRRNICDSALMYNKNALQIFSELKNEFHKSQVLYSMGKNHICVGNLDSAEWFLNQAEILAREKENVFTLRNISEQFVKLFQERQQWRRAFDASRQLRMYEDSLFSMEKAEAIFEIKEKFESEQKNRLIAEQNAELAAQNEHLAKSELENSRKNFWILLMGGGVLATVFLLFVGYRRSSQKQELLIREKEIKVKEEKLRISKELHDNIGARLSHIISSLEIRLFKNREDDEIAAISAFAKDTMNQLRETIWAVSSKTIFYSELKQRIEYYIAQVDAIATCEISSISTCKADFELSSTQTINMFRIIQEGVNNALKYSNASKIEVLFESDEREVKVSISDNGCGFDPEQSSKLGSGLEGMKSRADEIGVELSINSSAESGSRITMTFGYQ